MIDPVFCSLIRIQHQRLRELRRALLPYKYVGCMYLILSYTSRNPGASQEDIACFYALDKTSVARDAKKLEALGHIERKTTPDNRRRYQLYLTGEGREFMSVIQAVNRDYAKKMSAGIADGDWETLTELLGKVEANCAEKL